jgi:hypothetical protein
VEGVRAEYIGARQTLHDLQHRTGSFAPGVLRDALAFEEDMTSPLAFIKIVAELGGLNEQESAQATARLQGRLLPGAWQGGKMLSDDDYAKEVGTVNRFFATILALAEQPNYLRTADAAVRAAEGPIHETALAALVVPIGYTSGFLQAIRRGEARLHGTQCLVALRRWQLEHAEPPPDLETLVKAAGMRAAPMDPFSDQPLRMGSIEEQPVIYSIGPDGHDDLAKIEWNMSPRERGDFIFRLEGSPP